ncbi:MAG: DUF4760 domain-containing protein [Rhodobacteraceae bacterium]|nr:DUF4760 domain-containing protein [Paracoccaceae bacterium]
MTDFTWCSDVLLNPETAQTIVCAVPVSDTLDYWRLGLGLLSPIVLVIGVYVALRNIGAAKETARRKATLDMIEKVESMPHYRAMHETFAYHRRLDSFLRLIDPQETKDREERTNVHDYLNHYELVSIGIKNEILDEDFYKSWMKGPFVRDWNAAAKFVQRERWKYDADTKTWTYHEQLFEHFQSIAVAWSEEAKRLDKNTSGPPKKPEGPGDEAYPDGEAQPRGRSSNK